VVVAGRTVLEADSPVVWLTFPGAWHDIGRFHTPDGRFTGFYANILTPVRIETEATGDEWETTDLFLDVFVTPDGAAHLLDRDELDEARREGWIDAPLAARAEAEAERLVARARAGSWPPPVARAWTLERARRRAP
jgi:predicted RNA-binding protein associated with RNAse of E/G family